MTVPCNACGFLPVFQNGPEPVAQRTLEHSQAGEAVACYASPIVIPVLGTDEEAAREWDRIFIPPDRSK